MQATCAAPTNRSRHVKSEAASASVELRSSCGRALLQCFNRFRKSSVKALSRTDSLSSSSSMNGHKSKAACTALSRMKVLFRSETLFQRLSRRGSNCAPEVPPDRPKSEFTTVSSIRRLRHALRLGFGQPRTQRLKMKPRTEGHILLARDDGIDPLGSNQERKQLSTPPLDT